MMSAGRASGFELVKEQIVFNRSKSRNGTRENMAKLYKKYKFDDRIPAMKIPGPAQYIYRQLVPCSFFIGFRFQCMIIDW